MLVLETSSCHLQNADGLIGIIRRGARGTTKTVSPKKVPERAALLSDSQREIASHRWLTLQEDLSHVL